VTYVPADLRRIILDRSAGCCEYCRVHGDDSGVNYHVEHVIAVSHSGQTVESNLAYSCARCNLYKGTNIAAADPDTGNPTFLFHPRRDNWDDHFRLEGAVIQPLTAEGRATVFVLRLNDPQRVMQRDILRQLERYPCWSETDS
jgi:hypothetical protein